MALIVSACNLGSSSNQPSIQEYPWGLIILNQGNLLEGTRISLRFEGNQVTGSAAYNVYSASHEDARKRIAFGPIVHTEMACVDIPGIMDQEKMYLEILGAAQSYEETEDVLTIVSESDQTLNVQPLPPSLSDQASPSDEQPSVRQANPTDEPVPTQPATIVETPVGFKEFQDSQTGISIDIPDEWYIQNQSVVEGECAIFSSCPPDKYTGGEARQPGDT